MSSHEGGDDGSNTSGKHEDDPCQGSASSVARQSYASTDKMLNHLGITPKIAPAYDGTTSFEYEQLIDERCDITTLDEDESQDQASGMPTIQGIPQQQVKHTS